MNDDYGELTITEVRRLAANGDAKAQQMLDEMHAEIQAAYNNAPPKSLMGFMRNIDRFQEGDIEAAKMMAKYQYSKGKLFHPKRLELLQDCIEQRFTEENIQEDTVKSFNVWWVENIIIPAMALVLYKPEIVKLPVTDVYKMTRKEVRGEIEINLTDGFTTDQKEFLQVILILDMIPNVEDDGEKPDDEELDQSDFEDIFISKLHGFVIRETENWLIIKQKLERLPKKDIMVILQPLLGNDKQLADKMGVSIEAFRTRRSRAIGELRKSRV